MTYDEVAEGGTQCGGAAFESQCTAGGFSAGFSSGFDAGSCDSNEGSIFNHVGTGGVRGGGAATATSSRSYIGSGGARLNGSSNVVYSEVGSGGVTVGGELPVEEAGVFVGGAADVASIFSLSASGGVLAGGRANISMRRNLRYTSDGLQVLISSDTNTGIESYRYSGRGGIVVGGDNEPVRVQYKFNKDYTFTWRAQAVLEKDYTFYWNLGRLRIYWYRIIGKGRPGNECPLVADPCCQKFIMNVHARTLGELCEKLQKRRYKFPIESVQRFSRPAQNAEVAADEADGINHDCNTLTPIQLCNVPQCADFCVEQDLRQRIGFFMKVQLNAFKQYVATGAAFMGGAASASYERFLPEFPYTASTSTPITMGGSADCAVDSYVAKGGITAGGRASVASNRWSFIGGVWPNTETRFATSADSQLDNVADIPWDLTERALVNDGLYTQSDISFGKKSEFLIVRGFRFDLPTDSSVLGIKVGISRLATQTGMRDEEVYLVRGNQVISDNLADTAVDWPLIQTLKYYGSDGLNGTNLWRNPLGSHAGDFTIDEVNDEEFGVAIRVHARTSVTRSIARINYINLQVYYEDADGSIIRMGGQARAESESYHYASTGFTLVSGNANLRVGLRYRSTGKLSNASPAITIGGSYGLHLSYTANGSVATVGGEAGMRSSYHMISASGGVRAGGDAKITPYFEVGTGGAQAGGTSKALQRFKYTGDGSITLGGVSFIPAVVYRYTGSGPVVFGSATQVRTPHWKWTSDGNAVFILGGAGQKASNIGTPVQRIGFSMRVLQTTATFLNDVDLNDVAILTDTVSKCDCLQLPLVIEMSHNMVRDNVLAKFLVRNNFTIPRALRLKYNDPNDSWQCNLHYRGLAADGNTREEWALTFELSCADFVGGTLLGRSIWKFAAQVVRKNLTTLDTSESRVLVAVLPDLICGPNTEMDYTINYDTQLEFAVVSPNAAVYQNTVYDNIGLFKTPAWVDDPELVIRVSQKGISRPVERYDATPFISI